MMRKLAVVGAAMGVLLTAEVAGAQAHGQEFGQKGEFILSADRLVPVLAFTENKITNNNVNPNQTFTTTGSAISILWGNNSVFSGANAPNLGLGAGNPTAYTTPRVGFDYVIIPNLTIGGDLLVFFTLGGSVTTPAGGGRTVSTDTPSGNLFGIAPRVGYILGLSEPLSIWLRGGFSFYHAGTSQADNACGTNPSDTNSLNVFGIDLDPQLVISPVPHFAFTAGPAFDFGFAGGASHTQPTGPTCNQTLTTSYGYSSWNIGLTAGLLGWF